ncbi:hypothetical protein F4604DRAFT_1713149 [Suillus subluteus]|nr:hypothetical protein F4604DRAFT_1713149 [Suillus subluteus]
MSYLYLAVRYFGGGLFYMPEAIGYGMFLLMQWGFSIYFCLAEVILIWRLYALYNQSKRLLYVLLGLFLPIVALYIAVDIFLWSRPSAISMQEIIITPNIKYCTSFFHIGPMPAVYASIPVICYDIFLVVLAISVLRKHLKERRELKIRSNGYLVMIVRHHVIYFVLNLATQIFMAIMWADLPVLSPVIIERSALMQACTDSGDVSRTVVQRYRAIYYRLRLLDFATDVGTIRDGLPRMML